MSRRRPLRRRPFVAAALALGATACAVESGVVTERAEPASDGAISDATAPPETDPPTTGGSAPSTADPSGDLEWSEYSDGVESARLEVPRDYENPDGPTFELFLARRLADDQENKIGSLLVNPGGPGFGGSDFAIFADQVYDEALLERFDIVGWDPRGSGESEPAIDCIDDYDYYFSGTDITPDDDAEKQEVVDLAEEFADRCAESNADILEFVGTNNSARDIDSIRQALGEDQISYFGFSYGSELGATWATLFPDTVRAAVLDGASDPTSDPVQRASQQLTGFESALTTYLAQCSDDPDCAFHNDGDAEGAFDTLMLELDEEPIPSEPGRPDIARGEALQAVTEAMYTDSLWDQLSEALAEAQEGQGAGLLALFDRYFQRNPDDGTWGNQLEAYQSISCMDRAPRPTVEEWDGYALTFNEVAPRMAPGVTGEPYLCVFFPPTNDPRGEITGAGAGPIVVVGTTGDAATPLESTAMADTLEDGRLVVVDADQHTGYGVNDCVEDAVHRFLIDLEAPADETEC